MVRVTDWTQHTRQLRRLRARHADRELLKVLWPIRLYRPRTQLHINSQHQADVAVRTAAGDKLLHVYTAIAAIRPGQALVYQTL